MDEKTFRYETEIKIEPSSITELNPQFSLCDILVCYHGDNRNRTSISKSVIENALFSLYGVPIVGEWVYKQDGTDEKTWGSHGGKIVIDDNGIRFEQTTKPLGFVTKDAVEHAEWVKITEKDGHTKHEYLKLSGCILWTERMEETKTILEKNYGQSMEVVFQDDFRREDGYWEAKKITFSALCVLGTAQPCFESAMIGRHYAYEDFKLEFSNMLNEYKKYTKEQTEEVTDEMKKEIISILKGFTFKNQADEQTEKFALLSMRDKEIDVIDREADYAAYTLQYTVMEDGKISVDLETKTPKTIGLMDEYESNFNLKSEIDTVATSTANTAVHAFESKVVDELNQQLKELSEKYNLLQKDYTCAKSKLDTYAEAEQKAEEEKHRKEIDAKLDEYSSKIGGFSEYLMYRSHVDYSKTVEQVDVDMLVLLGKYNKKKTTTFNYNPMVLPIDNMESSAISNSNSRYGNLFDSFK